MRKFLIAVTAAVLLAFAVPVFAASNPFMDVPANHWAYDAIAQLASRGVLSGYPDGSYKGGQPATRYEMASAVARMLAKVDMEKASKQDLELLKKLVLELKDELDALGVKVDKIDSRLKVMEKDLGGWSMSGELRFDAKFGADENHNSWFQDDFELLSGKNEFDLNQYRLYIMKRIDDKTSFTARFGPLGGSNDSSKAVGWERYYVETMLPYDIKLSVGLQWIEWEGFTLGLAKGGRDYDAWIGNLWGNVIMLEKDWGMASLKLAIMRPNDSQWNARPADQAPTWANVEYFLVAGLANFDITEKFTAGLMGYYQFADKEVFETAANRDTDSDLGTYGIYLKYAFTPSIQLKGVYYHQTHGDSWARMLSGGADDKAKAWKVILDVKQDALKFTSLWLEYGQIDNNFLIYFGNRPSADYGVDLLYNQKMVRSSAGTSKVFGGFAEQKWNDKWSTFLRYFQVDHDVAGLDDASEWTVGLAYQYSSAIKFELAYDKIDYGTGPAQTAAGNPYRSGDDNVVRFRTYVAF